MGITATAGVALQCNLSTIVQHITKHHSIITDVYIVDNRLWCKVTKRYTLLAYGIIYLNERCHDPRSDLLYNLQKLNKQTPELIHGGDL